MKKLKSAALILALLLLLSLLNLLPTDEPSADLPSTQLTQSTEASPTESEQTLPPQTESTQASTEAATEPALDPAGSYTTKEDVALYIHLYKKLPGNFITKNEARSCGWDGGSVESYAPGKCIGGDTFSNREGLLPAAAGRTYRECDIDTLGSYDGRGAKRIVFSNDGLIYYTDDHYESFTLLYGEP